MKRFLCLRFLCFWIVMTVLLAPSVLAATDVPVGELARVLQGTNPPGSSVEETPLGDVVADAVRQITGADVAIVNGGYIIANLQPGEVYEDDIAAVFSAPEELVIVSMTRDELLHWLENGVSHVLVGEDERVDPLASVFDGFPQISGFTFRYDPSAPVGARVTMLLLEGESDTVAVACTAVMAAGAFGYEPHEAQATEYDLVSAMTAYFSGRTVEPPEPGRSKCIGTADNTLIRQYPALLFVLVAVGLFILYAKSVGKKKWLDI